MDNLTPYGPVIDPLSVISLVNSIACAVGLGLVVAVRPKAHWLLGFLMVVVVMLADQMMRADVGIIKADPETIRLVALLSSGLSTWMLASIALGILGEKSSLVRFGVLSLATTTLFPVFRQQDPRV